MAMEIAAMCEMGTRESQQDSYLYHVKNDLILAVVCDGMGGLDGGDEASKCVVNKLQDDYKLADFQREDIPSFFRKEVIELDKEIYRLKNGIGEKLGAGSTIVAVIIEKDQMYWLTVGDSRIFVLRGNEIVPVNAKHNYKLQLDEMLERNHISKQVYESEMKHADKLISYLGIGDISIWEINNSPLKLHKGDYILLCSDGITDAIEENRIKEIILKEISVEDSLYKFKTIIREKDRFQDNATCILIKYV